MAASSAGNHSTPHNTKPFEFSAVDFPPRISLTADQYNHCSEALSFFKEKLQNKSREISQEFARLQASRIKPSEMARGCTVALDGVNLSKNRYTDILPFDKNRVVLKQCKDYRPAARGYINASLISTSSSEKVSQFIATQGPLPHTYEDFWEMVIQYHCPVIVMLTRLVDNYKMVKCGDYFQAEDGPREFGNICIVTKWIKTTETALVLRNLEMVCLEGRPLYIEGLGSCLVQVPDLITEIRIEFDGLRSKSEEPPMSVLHIQYPEWPDHGVPRDTLAVREILKRIYNLPPNFGPIVVHCSAGIGRTGAYCTIHNTVQRILVGDMSALDLANTVKEQYIFCHQAIVDELEDLISGFNSERTSKCCYRSWAWCLIPEMFKKLPQIGARDVVTPGSVPYICICKHYYEEPVFFFCAMPIYWWIVEIFSVELNNATTEVGSDLCP
ncbi:protein-tyrosine-phosphatase PTP1 [Citrus sinensis]|uniref:Protein-tyrosine-phosphatase PTP1 n=1 Tax=Citrus sinensis TaxID=2711 RepID=A0ACB8KU70_CITSI|nr:protein-tyrosine-phosphatase PTP1 [Citrus sinensis]